MSKKPKSLSSIGDIRKPERVEPEVVVTPVATKPKAPKKPAVAKKAKSPEEKPSTQSRGRGRPAERVPYIQLNTRIRMDTSNQIDEIAQKNGWTIREVIERSIENLHNKK